MPDKELLERVEDRLVAEEAAYLDVMEHGSSISTLHKTQRIDGVRSHNAHTKSRDKHFFHLY